MILLLFIYGLGLLIIALCMLLDMTISRVERRLRPCVIMASVLSYQNEHVCVLFFYVGGERLAHRLLKISTETNRQWSDKNVLASFFGIRARLLILWPVGKGL